ncbi:MAG: histidine kinase N-terminal 7TM domain-containing protein, partial [Syntrophales bacterium]|nr:histidine kinase N-terminal 7TM domain-containing protein [Syntrophales bacterium]
MNSFSFAIGAFVNAGLALILGVFVYFQNRKKIENILFFLSNLCLTIWGFFFGLWQLTSLEKTAIIFCRLLTSGVLFIPALMLHWVLALLGIHKKQKLVLISSYLASFIFLLSDLTPNMVSGVRSEMFFKFWPIPGPHFIFFLIYSLVTMLYMLLLLIQNYRGSIGIKRTQLKYVFFGLFIGYLAAYSTIPLWYQIQVIPFGYFFLAAYSFIFAYTIIRYQLMDIRFILGRTAVYLLSFSTILSIAFLMVFIGNKIAGFSSLSVASSLVLGLALIVSMLLFNPVFRIFENFASKYFYYTFYNYQRVLADLGEKLTQVLDLNALSFLNTDTLLKTIKLDRIAII